MTMTNSKRSKKLGLIKFELEINVSNFKNYFFLIVASLQKSLAPFRLEKYRVFIITIEHSIEVNHDEKYVKSRSSLLSNISLSCF